ncbi:hypothetical protein [Nocardia sp. CA-135398]|uniref:hypothetical protein n=1 Tax=Nocardia sp. CA-135398 TaxID=3239977 RepID=UPI003D99CC8B
MSHGNPLRGRSGVVRWAALLLIGIGVGLHLLLGAMIWLAVAGAGLAIAVAGIAVHVLFAGFGIRWARRRASESSSAESPPSHRY